MPDLPPKNKAEIPNPVEEAEAVEPEQILNKVTAFITRTRLGRGELLLFEHPTAGIQIPAGTVDPEEDPTDAVMREALEETGLESLHFLCKIGESREDLEQGEKAVLFNTPVFARPSSEGVESANLQRGGVFTAIREQDGFVQVSHTEWNNLENPEYIMWQLTGWVPSQNLTNMRLRRFYHLTANDDQRRAWYQKADNHTFRLFWADLDDLPSIIPPQDRWLNFIRKECGYSLNLDS